MKEVANLGEFNSYVAASPVTIAYFSTETCNVCKVALPKINELVNSTFPKAELLHIIVERAPELAAQKGVYTASTLIVYFEGKEAARKGGAFSLSELKHIIDKGYGVLY